MRGTRFRPTLQEPSGDIVRGTKLSVLHQMMNQTCRRGDQLGIERQRALIGLFGFLVASTPPSPKLASR